jgi:hypothetical protein
MDISWSAMDEKPLSNPSRNTRDRQASEAIRKIKKFLIRTYGHLEDNLSKNK